MKNEFKLRVVIFGFASKLKRNYWFLPLIVLLLLFCTLITTSTFEAGFNITNYDKAFKEEYNDYVRLPFFNIFSEKRMTYGELKNENFGDFLASTTHTVTDSTDLRNVVKVNEAFVREMDIPIVGKWFSNEIPNGYLEGIVSNDLKSKYKIGSSYKKKIKIFNLSEEKKVEYDYIDVKFKVIGYFKYSLVNAKEVFSLDFAGRNSILLLDSFVDSQYVDDIFVKGDKAFFEEKYGYTSISLREIHNNKIANNKTLFSLSIYMFILIFSLAIGAMMGNTLLKDDYERRRNSVYFICGQSKKTYLLTKLFEMLVVLAFSAIIYFGVLFPISESIVELIFMTDMYLTAGSAVAGFATIYGLYALAEGFYIFKTMRSNFLEEVSRE